jgi:thioredoxin reductase (NADPH)
MADKKYDVIILGSGPAGVSAAIYAKRFALKTLLVGEAYGGAISRTHIIENYPGFVTGSGYDMMQQWKKNLENLKVETLDDFVRKIERKDSGPFVITFDFEGETTADAIIYCTGAKERKLKVPGEDKLHGRGVSYCATCDGPFFREKIIAIVGGSDSAVKEALFLSNFGQKVYIIYRRDKLRAEPINLDRLDACDKVEVIYNTNVVEVLGEKNVESVKLDKPYNGSNIFKVNGLFIEIGSDPRSDLAEKLGVKLNEKKEIIVDEQMKTNVPGIFAAGDVVNRREKQVVVAAGHGAIAAYSAREYIENLCGNSCDLRKRN